MRRVALIAAVLLAAAGPAAAGMTDVEKKVCLVLAAGKLPALPGGAITAAVVADDEASAAAAVARAVRGLQADFREADRVLDVYDVLADTLRREWQAAKAERRDEIIRIGLEAHKSKAGSAEVTVKAGVLEATYGFNCIGIRGRVYMQLDGLVR